MQSNNSIVEGPQGLTPLTPAASLSDIQVVKFPGRKGRTLSLLQMPSGEVFLPVEQLDGSDARGVFVCPKWLRIGLLSDSERKELQASEDPAVRDRFTYNGCHDHRQDQLVCFYHADRVCRFEGCARLHIDFAVGTSESAVINLYNSMEEIPRARSLVLKARPARLSPGAAAAVAAAAAAAVPTPVAARVTEPVQVPVAPVAVAAAAPRYPTLSVSVFEQDYVFPHNVDTDMIEIRTSRFAQGVWVCRKWVQFMLTNPSKRGEKPSCHEHAGPSYTPLCGFQASCRKEECRWQHFLKSCFAPTAPVAVAVPVMNIETAYFPPLSANAAPVSQQPQQGYSMAAAVVPEFVAPVAATAVAAVERASTKTLVQHGRNDRKTAMCRIILAGDDCERGSACAFAHSIAELRPHPSGLFRVEFIEKLTRNALPEDFFVQVWDEVLRVMTEPKNLQCLSFLGEIDSRQLGINLDTMIIKRLQTGTFNTTDFVGILHLWSMVSKFMRSDDRTQKQIAFPNDFALFGEVEGERETDVLALCELTRRCDKDFHHCLGNPFAVVAERIADVRVCEQAKSRMYQYLCHKSEASCTFYQTTCPAGGHNCTMIDLRAVVGDKASFKEALDGTRLRDELTKLEAEYEGLIREGLTLYDLKFQETEDADGFAQVRAGNLRDARIKELQSFKEARALGKRSLPIVGKELKDTYVALMSITKRFGVCPITNLLYKPLNVLEAAPAPVVSAPAVPVATSATSSTSQPPKLSAKQMRKLARARVRAAAAEADYDSCSDAEGAMEDFEEMGGGKASKGAKRMCHSSAVPVYRKQAKQAKVMEVPESAPTFVPSVSDEAPVREQIVRVTEVASDDEVFNSGTRSQLFEVVVGMSKKERLKLEREERKQAAAAAAAADDNTTHAETQRRHKHKTAAPLTLEQQFASVEAELAAELKKLAALQLEDSESETESESDDEVTFATSMVAVSTVRRSRFFDEDSSSDSGDDAESASDSSSEDDDCSSICSDDDEITRADKRVKQLRRKRRDLFESLQVPTLRTLTEDETHSVKAVALEMIQSEFVPLSEGSRFVIRTVLKDNDGKARGTSVPIVFGPFKYERAAIALKDDFKGISVSVDLLSKLLNCKEDDAVPLDPKEEGYYIKFNAKNPRKTCVRVEIATKCLNALVSAGLVPIDQLAKQVGIFLPSNSKGDDAEVAMLADLLATSSAAQTAKPAEPEPEAPVVDAKQLALKLKRYDTQVKLDQKQLDTLERKIVISSEADRSAYVATMMRLLTKIVEDLDKVKSALPEEKYAESYSVFSQKRTYWEARA
jgi:hypothetical protein